MEGVWPVTANTPFDVYVHCDICKSMVQQAARQAELTRGIGICSFAADLAGWAEPTQKMACVKSVDFALLTAYFLGWRRRKELCVCQASLLSVFYSNVETVGSPSR